MVAKEDMSTTEKAAQYAPLQTVFGLGCLNLNAHRDHTMAEAKETAPAKGPFSFSQSRG
jgi:hypothetical protein